MPVGAMGILPNFSAVGCLIMIAALKRLRYYAPDCKGFKAAYFTLIPQMLLSLVLFVFGVTGFGADEGDAVGGMIVDITELCTDLLVAITAVCLFIGVYRLAHQVELPRLASRSVRMISFTAAHIALAVTAAVTGLMRGNITDTDTLVVFNYIDMAAFVFEYAFLFLSLAFFFTCYVRICLEGDEEMPYREDAFDKIVAWFKKNKNR